MASASPDMTGDSSILRYIKTLSSHQTNAKQQRLDRYLRQVKHSQPAEKSSTTSWKLPATKSPDRTALERSPSTEGSTTQLLKQTARTKQFLLQHSDLHNQGARSTQGKRTSPTDEYRPQQKRQRKGAQSYQQRKKIKQPPSKQLTAAVGALDRFRHGTWAQDKSLAAGGTKTALSTSVTAPGTSNQAAQRLNKGVARYQVPAVTSGIPESTKSQRWSNDTASQRCFVEMQPHFNAPSPGLTSPAAHASWRSLTLPTSFVQTSELKTEDLGGAFPATEEAFVGTNDPLIAIMASIYF
ncbi:unnamed protein product [Phytophthora lilii]|uniref:Unnamed protein product n=1 Tax=Phytophthora lilii TaxID=2077276 RepID=A0A9W7DCX2_9STRA|nr:unnamed protein product [Phytophthora lilii]